MALSKKNNDPRRRFSIVPAFATRFGGNRVPITTLDYNNVVGAIQGISNNQKGAITTRDLITWDATGVFIVTGGSAVSNCAYNCYECSDTEKTNYTCNCNGGPGGNTGEKCLASAPTIFIVSPGHFTVTIPQASTESSELFYNTILQFGNPSSPTNIISVVKTGINTYDVSIYDVVAAGFVAQTLSNVPLIATRFYRVPHD